MMEIDRQRASATSSSMILKLPFGLRVLEGHPELVNVTVGQVKTFEVGAPDPATAVIRTEFVVSYNDDARIRDLDTHLAG